MDIIFQRTTGRLQKIVLSLAGILLICTVPLLLSVLWLIWDHHIFFLQWWWWLHSRCDLSGRKSLKKNLYSTKDHGNLGENIPFNVQIMGCCQF